MATLDRVYGQGALRRAKNIDYRHLIASLVKKPMAFYKSVHRDALLPNACYKQIWQKISSNNSSREASRLMVGLLHLAANTNQEKQVSDRVIAMLNSGEPLSITRLRGEFEEPGSNEHMAIESTQHDMTSYNDLIPNGSEANHAMH